MAAMRPQPVSPELLPDLLADLLAAALPGPGRLRVLLDGPPAARPDRLADALVDPLRVRGVAPLRVSAADFLRPASVRLEHGRTDPQAYYESWTDHGGLRREALDPLGPEGSGRWLPTLWDATADRATRQDYRSAPSRAVLLLDGALLLGRGLPHELAIHLRLSAAARQRRTPPDERWILPAFERYEREVRPTEAAAVVVLADDPDHPALLVRDEAVGNR
jgi:hypothetical protein